MLKVGNIYKFEIIDIGMNFEGIAKDDEGLTVFIPDVLKGEVVEAKIKKVSLLLLLSVQRLYKLQIKDVR